MKQSDIPQEFIQCLTQHLKRFYLPSINANASWNKKDIAYFSKGIVKLNESFTTTKSSREVNYFQDPLMRSGYLAYFLPVNAAKAKPFFSTISPHLPKKRIKILDIGAGPLTLMCAYAQYLHSINKTHKIPSEIEYHAVEQNEKIAKEGALILNHYWEASGLSKKSKLKIIFHFTNAVKMKLKEKDFDLIEAGNFLNEIPERDDQKSFILQLSQTYSHKTTVLFMLEPASKKISRDLQSLRDELLEQTAFKVLAPCLHQNTCPLNLTAKGDWCNFIKEWQAPDFIQDFDKLTHLKKTNLLYSYLIFKNEATPLIDDQQFVAISHLMREPGRFELLGCGPAGRVRFIRSHKNESDFNQDFSRFTRGSYFSCPTFKSNGFELNRIFNISKNDVIKNLVIPAKPKPS